MKVKEIKVVNKLVINDETYSKGDRVELVTDTGIIRGEISYIGYTSVEIDTEENYEEVEYSEIEEVN